MKQGTQLTHDLQPPQANLPIPGSGPVSDPLSPPTWASPCLGLPPPRSPSPHPSLGPQTIAYLCCLSSKGHGSLKAGAPGQRLPRLLQLHSSLPGSRSTPSLPAVDLLPGLTAPRPGSSQLHVAILSTAAPSLSGTDFLARLSLRPPCPDPRPAAVWELVPKLCLPECIGSPGGEAAAPYTKESMCQSVRQAPTHPAPRP